MKTSIRKTAFLHRTTLLISVATLLALALAIPSQAYPIGGVTFRDDAPFKGASGVHSLTSGDGLLTVEAWGDTNATSVANLYQWWWLLGVDNDASTNDNGALLDQQEALTLQFDTAVGASHIAFLYTGGSGGTGLQNLARVNVSGFLSDPGAYATTWTSQRIFNLSYTNGIVSFDYLWDTGNDYGQLLFSNPAASKGQRLKITGSVSPSGNATNYGVALFRVNCQEIYGRPTVSPVAIKHNFTNSYTTPDGALTVRGYANSNATTAANLGTYVDQCFGVYGAANNGAVDTDESVTLQFATGFGLGRLDTVYSSGQVTISGFAGDPGFSDPGNGSFGVVYADGALSFYPLDGGYHRYFFTNRTASAGRTLRINVDPAQGYSFTIAGIDYVNLKTVVGSDIPSNMLTTYSTADNLLTVNAYSDTPGTTPAYFNMNVDWLGVSGGNNTEAIDGTESLGLQFSGRAGLSGFGTRYTSGRVIISGFASDPGFTDPSGIATNITYSAGTLSYTFNAYRAPEIMVSFSNLAASAGRTLSMHTDGDPGSQIALTRITYGLEPVKLTIAREADKVILTWPTGTLQQSDNATGIYSDLGTATSPYTNSITGMQKFYRIRVQ